MKKYKATLWRYNPQLPNGGYETTRSIEAKNSSDAWSKAREIICRVTYGSMAIIKVEEE